MPLPEPAPPPEPKQKKPRAKKKGLGKKEPTVDDLARQQRKLAALNLRKAGWDFAHIAETLGIEYTEAVFLVKEELAHIVDACQDSAAELLVLELERLDELYRYLHAKAQRGDARAIEVMLKISERRAKLCGLDAPEAKEITVRLASLTDDELRAEYERLGFTAQVALGHVLDVIPVSVPLALDLLPGEALPTVPSSGPASAPS